MALAGCGPRAAEAPAGSGGSIGAGGIGATGGVPSAVGGVPAVGGAPAVGGSAAGGTASTGGGAATGGATGSGGDSAAGGTTPGSGGAAPAVDKFIGNLVHKNNDIVSDFADHWMQITMEANAKWGFVQPDPGTWVWEPVDQAWDYAAENGLLYKQHAFFWNFEQPDWVDNTNVAAAAETWVQTFCERYPGIEMIDVVNEPLSHAPPYMNGLGGTGTSGYDWLVNAFQMARDHCPGAILLINDYNIIEWPQDHADFITLLQGALDAGAPIDAIGVQGHDVYAAGVPTAIEYIDEFTELFGLPIYVTEFDIDLADDDEQLAVMQEAITAFWEHPNVHGITYWGFQQGLMWRPNAYLVRTDGTDRPALTWLKQFIAEHR